MTDRRRAGIRSAKRPIQAAMTLSLATLAIQPAFAADAISADGATADEVVVNGQRQEVQSPKYTQPLLNTPQTIQVIDKSTFNQQGATTLTEALRNSPGVGTFYAGENGATSTGDAIYMRGFDTSNSIFVDGIRDVGSYSRDIFNIDQVEVEKGPAGTDNGRTAPTGAINMVSKTAKLGNAVSGTGSVGVDGQKRATIDINQALDGWQGAAVRLNAVWQDSGVPGRDHVTNKRVGVAPSFSAGLNGPTQVHLNLLYVKQDNIPDGFVPTVGLPYWSPQPGLEKLAGHPVDPSNFYGTQDDHDNVTAEMATLIVDHEISDGIKLTNSARWGRTTEDYLATSYTVTGGTAAAPMSGNVKWTDPDNLATYTLARSNPSTKDQANEILTDQLNLRADFEAGGIKNSVSTGLEVTHEQQSNYGLTVSGARPAANLYDPNFYDVGTLSIERNGGLAKGQTDTVSAYLFDTVKVFDDKLLITGGARADHFDTKYHATAACTNGTTKNAVQCGANPIGTIVQTADLKVKDTLFNWKLGAVYKPVKSLSLYVDYALSQQPPGGANFSLSTSTTSLDNPNLKPEKARTLEGGAKWSTLHNKLVFNLAVFRTNVTNEINSSVLDDSGNPTQTGEKRVEGVEFSATGNITEAWSVMVGYSHLHTEVLDTPVVTADGTPNLTYTPDDAVTSWTTYKLPFGLTIGGGVRYTGGLHKGTDPAVGTPTQTKAWTVLDGLLSYDIGEHLTLRANAYNLFDKKYVAAINKSGYRYTPGTPRTFLFSADVRF